MVGIIGKSLQQLRVELWQADGVQECARLLDIHAVLTLSTLINQILLLHLVEYVRLLVLLRVLLLSCVHIRNNAICLEILHDLHGDFT